MNQVENPALSQLQLMQNEINDLNNDLFDTVQFSLFTEDDLLELSSLDITLNDIRENFKSKFSTGIELIDNNPLLGTTDPNQICPTCNQNGRDCPGHYCTIELPFYLANPNYLNKIAKLLNCICLNCGKIKYDEKLTEFNAKKIPMDSRLDYFSLKLQRNILCEECTLLLGYKIRTIDYEGRVKVIFGLKRVVFQVFKIQNSSTVGVKISQKFGSPEASKDGLGYQDYITKCPVVYEEVYKLFSKISAKDAKFLGFGENHPRFFIMKKLLVIPPVNRPTLQDGNKLYVDGITKAYSNVLMTSLYFIEKDLSNYKAISECEERFQNDQQRYDTTYEVDFIFKFVQSNDIYLQKAPLVNAVYNLYKSNQAKPITDKPKDVPTSVSFRNKINGKEGLMRRFMMGKRVNYTARTVVGPSPDFEVNEIGVPKFIAQNLTVPVHVTNFNYTKILELQKNDKIKSVIKMNNGNKKRVLFSKDKPITIKIGDIIERELMDGDYVLANRNPTIQKQGMMGLRARIINENIFRLNLALTPPFNADFDGDEMNIFVPQTVQAMSDLSTIASAEGCYGNQQSSNLMVGLVFDAVTGSFILSQDFIYIEEDTFHQLAFGSNLPDDFLRETKNYNYGVGFVKTKQKYYRCIQIVYNYLYIHVQKIPESVIKNIMDNVERFEANINIIDPKRFEQDYEAVFSEKFDDTSILNQVIRSYFTRNDDDYYKNLITVYLQSEFFNKIIENQINLEKNDYQYLLLFIDKLAYYYSKRNFLMEDITKIDNKNHYFDQCLSNNLDIHSGKALFSLILPKMNYDKIKKGNTPLETYNNAVKIKQGILYQGWLNKEHVGGNSNSIPHILFLYQDTSVVSFFLTYAQRLINQYFTSEGFTIGLHDCMLNDTIKDSIGEQLNTIRHTAYGLEKDLKTDDENEKEEKIITALQEIRLLNDTVVKSLDIRSPLLIMAELAKAKGKGANLVQIMAAIGQQYYGGKRIKNETPYFEKNDPDPMARGLCINSFVDGMTPSEFVYHMYSSREGLVEGAIKTGDCGAMHHNIAKVLEVLTVKEDRSIRNIQGRVIQFIYGEDGFDAEYLQKVKISENVNATFIDVKYIAETFNQQYTVQ